MGGVEIEDCVTMAQFNELRQSMEEKQDRLTRDLQALLTEIRGRRQPHDGASHHGEDGEDSDGRAAARRAREQGGTEVPHMVEEEVEVEEMMTMMNLKMRMMIIILNITLVTDIEEEATMRRGLEN